MLSNFFDYLKIWRRGFFHIEDGRDLSELYLSCSVLSQHGCLKREGADTAEWT